MPTENRSSNTEMVSALAPCSCGKAPRISNHEGSAIHVSCSCGIQLWGAKAHFASEQACADEWNRRASLAEQHQGEPVGEIVAFGHGLHEASWAKGRMPELGTKLYTHPAPVVQKRYNSRPGYENHDGTTLAVLTLGAFDASQLGDIDIQVSMENAESLQQKLVSVEDIHVDLVSAEWARGLEQEVEDCWGTIDKMHMQALGAEDRAKEIADLRAQLAEQDALLRDKSGDLIRMAAHLISAPLIALQDLQDEDKKMTRARVDSAVDSADARLKDAAYGLRRIADALSASAEPSAPKCKGWTCFHCDEHFTDAESASIHFGTHEIQRPACLIDAAEYRSMEERVRECANEDSKLHRQLRRQASNHKLELQRAEEGGYAKGLADASAPVERDELKPCPFCGCEVTFLTGREDYRIAGAHSKVCPFLDLDVIVDSRAAWQARAALERKP